MQGQINILFPTFLSRLEQILENFRNFLPEWKILDNVCHRDHLKKKLSRSIKTQCPANIGTLGGDYYPPTTILVVKGANIDNFFDMKALTIRLGVPKSCLKKMSKTNIGRHSPTITFTYYILLVLKGNSFLFLFTIFTNIVHANDILLLTSFCPVVVLLQLIVVDSLQNNYNFS